MSTPHSKKILILSTGGTIASTLNESGALVPTRTARYMTEIAQESITQPEIYCEGKDLIELDSSAMTSADIDYLLGELSYYLASSSDLLGIILTHGTDTMEETAMALALMLPTHVPIVLTGAQFASDSSTADGPSNIATAVKYITRKATQNNLPPCAPAVAFAEKIFPAYGIRKVSTHSADAFDNPLTASEIPQPLVSAYSPSLRLAEHRVDIITAFPGAPASILKHSASSAQGLVVVGMGSGNVGTDFAKALTEISYAGLPVVLGTRVPNGGVACAYGGAGGGHTLAQMGVSSAGKLSNAQARIELQCRLAVEA